MKNLRFYADSIIEKTDNYENVCCFKSLELEKDGVQVLLYCRDEIKNGKRFYSAYVYQYNAYDERELAFFTKENSTVSETLECLLNAAVHTYINDEISTSITAHKFIKWATA